MSDTSPAAPTPTPQPARKPPLKQTPQTVPGPGLGTAKTVVDNGKHHVVRNFRGTAQSITAKVLAHPTLPEHEKTYLAAKINGMVGDWIQLDVHVFEKPGLVTVHAHISAQSAS